MEGVLDTLIGVLTPGMAVAEGKPAPTENCLPSTQAAVVIEHTATSAQDCELTGRPTQSDLNSDVASSQKALETLSDSVTSTELQSAVVMKAGGVDVNSVCTGSSESFGTSPEPQGSVSLSSSNIASESDAAKSDAVTQNKDIDARVIVAESLTRSLPPLSAMPLTVPLCPPRYLKLSFLPDEKLVSRFLHLCR